MIFLDERAIMLSSVRRALGAVSQLTLIILFL